MGWMNRRDEQEDDLIKKIRALPPVFDIPYYMAVLGFFGSISTPMGSVHGPVGPTITTREDEMIFLRVILENKLRAVRGEEVDPFLPMLALLQARTQ